MNDLATVLWIAVPVAMLACLGLCVLKACRKGRGGGSGWSCCGRGSGPSRPS